MENLSGSLKFQYLGAEVRGDAPRPRPPRAIFRRLRALLMVCTPRNSSKSGRVVRESCVERKCLIMLFLFSVLFSSVRSRRRIVVPCWTSKWYVPLADVLHVRYAICVRVTFRIWRP